VIAARAFHSVDFALFHEKTYLGEKSYVIASKDPLDLRLEIENSAGDVSVTFAESPALLSARIKVWGDEDASLTDAASFSERTNGLTTTVTFDSADDHSWGFFDHAGFSYDLIITIANRGYYPACAEPDNNHRTRFGDQLRGHHCQFRSK
jgi:hypothetical protein